jgi:hypothetical protein
VVLRGNRQTVTMQEDAAALIAKLVFAAHNG